MPTRHLTLDRALVKFGNIFKNLKSLDLGPKISFIDGILSQTPFPNNKLDYEFSVIELAVIAAIDFIAN
ncbi:MAG: hypothetical protein V3V00_07230 [Saprospiraceae bacterium]